MGETALSSERILKAAEDVLRRFGPDKATVVDVARVLGVTHGSVYRYFSSKVALRDAVVQRWLEATMPPLEAVSVEAGPATDRLRRWLDLLIAVKRRRATEDPELFAAYYALAVQAREAVGAHVDEMLGQLTRIIADGVAGGEFVAEDPQKAAKAVLRATFWFHNPTNASEWSDPGIDDAFEDVWQLLLAGLAARPKPPTKKNPTRKG